MKADSTSNQTKKKQTVSRLAPTPNGFLHLGNIYNFVLTWTETRRRGGTLHLRIDDLDQARVREEYIKDIFENLEWLGIKYDLGPSDLSDFHKNFSQKNFEEEYRNVLKQISDQYACECSRKILKETGSSKIYPGVCRDKNIDFRPSLHQIRLLCPDPTLISLANDKVNVAEKMGDFILWRKDDLCSYQLASVVDDHRLGINLIVRGQDLFDSSAAQLLLAQKLGYAGFLEADFIHHDLLLGPGGEKLSKSVHSQSLQQLRIAGFSKEKVFNQIARDMGIDHYQSINKIDDFLHHTFEKR